MVKALQIARGSLFYSQLVWSPVERVSKVNLKKKIDFLKLFFADYSGHLP